MRTSQILELSNVLEINKDSTNIIFIDKVAMSREDGQRLATMLKARHGADFGAIVFIRGNPNEVVKLISADDLKNATDVQELPS